MDSICLDHALPLPSRRILSILSRLSLFLLIAVCLGACDRGGESENTQDQSTQPITKATIGYPAPDFTLLDLSGEPVTLSEERGKVILLNFWATWCTPCRIEMPSMQSLYSGFNRDDFEILAVSSDVEGASVVKPFMEALHLTFPALIDADFQVTNLYQVRAVPATFLIDREGVITHRFLGAKMWNDQASRDLIRKLIQSN